MGYVSESIMKHTISKQHKKLLNANGLEYIAHGNIQKQYSRFQKLWTQYRFQLLKQDFTGTRVLEMGLADGHMTTLLSAHFKNGITIEGSAPLVTYAQKHLHIPHWYIIHTLFEEYIPDTNHRADTVIMTHVLEHVKDPQSLLQLVKNKWLAKNGRILVMVPNANSLHRQIGVMMGKISSVTGLDEGDKMVGHYRVYTRETLKHDVQKSGLTIKKEGGFFIKTLSNAQIEKTASDEAIQAMFEIGKKYPDIAAEIYLVLM
jgi:2-polyprenyl-3-methyl-5-hydroxy-6-metoxy-1,4-benzoquinol methylase